MFNIVCVTHRKLCKNFFKRVGELYENNVPVILREKDLSESEYEELAKKVIEICPNVISLIHDDLPCMDNDDYRRGRLTNHKVFGEALAVLAGDGLLTAAFETASMADADPAVAVKVIRILSEQAGELGMVGGQVLDMDAEEQELTEQGIYDIQCRKTGALIQAACQIGVVAAGGTQQQLDAAKTYAQNLGLAFQIRDDMLDVLGDAAKLGKATHVDENKNTFVRLYGIGACSKMIESETKTAIDALGCFENSDFLVEMARQLALREY